MVAPLRIAHVTATFPPYRGGTGNVCYYNARELARRGHAVTVFTAAVPGAPAREHRDGFEIRRLRPLLRVGNAPLLPQLVTSLDGYDIIHLHYPFIFGAEFVRLASAVHGIPFVITLHNDLIGDGKRAQLFANYQKLSAWTTVQHARAICAVSMDHYLSSNLCASLQGCPMQVVEVPNGVDTELFTPEGGTDVRERYGIPGDVKLVLFVAALDRAHHFKGLDRMLQALAALDQTIWLLVVGAGDLRAEYERQAEVLGVQARTIFSGAIAHDKLPPYFRAADVTVLPSSPPESFGLVLVESMACGTPVVASNIPGVRTVIDQGHDGLMATLGDISELSDKLAELIQLPGSKQVMGYAGRSKVVKRYAWNAIGGRLEEMVYYGVCTSARNVEVCGQGETA